LFRLVAEVEAVDDELSGEGRCMVEITKQNSHEPGWKNNTMNTPPSPLHSFHFAFTTSPSKDQSTCDLKGVASPIASVLSIPL
jgi:hypothetical protein